MFQEDGQRPERPDTGLRFDKLNERVSAQLK
jgi:hypothetical protein